MDEEPQGKMIEPLLSNAEKADRSCIRICNLAFRCQREAGDWGIRIKGGKRFLCLLQTPPDFFQLLRPDRLPQFKLAQKLVFIVRFVRFSSLSGGHACRMRLYVPAFRPLWTARNAAVRSCP